MKKQTKQSKRETPQDRYQRKWRKDYKLAVLTHLDADIVEKMETLENKTGYLKRLIREDIARQSKAG